MTLRTTSSVRRVAFAGLAVAMGLILAGEASAACSGEVTETLAPVPRGTDLFVCKWRVAVDVSGCTVTRTTFKGSGVKPATGTVTVGRDGTHPEQASSKSASGTNTAWRWTGPNFNCNTTLGCGTGEYYIHLPRHKRHTCADYGVTTVTVEKG